MPRRIDEIKVVHLPVARLVAQGCGLRLDGDAALALDIHRVKHLLFHLAVGQASAQMDDAVCQCGFAVVDVGNDGEITDMLHEAQNNKSRQKRRFRKARILADFDGIR